MQLKRGSGVSVVPEAESQGKKARNKKRLVSQSPGKPEVALGLMTFYPHISK